MAAARPLLAAHRVSRRFGARVALEATDLELQAGETVGLIGPNGAGKSTLLSILAGALEPSGGSVESHARVGWVPQRAALYRRLSVRENLELFARLEGGGDVAGMLDAFALPGDVVASSLSVGNRQRLNVAIALLGAPEVLLLDEPTASLDPEQRSRLWDDVLTLPERGGAAFLGRKFHILGLEGAQKLLAELPRGQRLDALREFVRDARLALAQTGDALKATANPIGLTVGNHRRTWLLGAQVQAYALALTLTFLALALAAERDENVIGRLARGLVGPGELVAAKAALAAVVAGGLGWP